MNFNVSQNNKKDWRHMKKMKQILMVFCFIPIYCTYGQLKVNIPFPVQVYHGNNLKSIVYELHLVDSLKRPVQFISFTIRAGNKVLLKDSICDILPKQTDTNRYVKYIWIRVDSVPKLLINTIQYKIDGKIYEFSKNIEIKEVPLLSIGLPVKRGIWYMEGPDNYDHRNFATPTKSQFDSVQNGYKLGYCNQRFAIDFDKVGDNGLLYKNDGTKNSDYYCFQEDLIAVADGIVVAVKDSIPDNPHPPNVEKFTKRGAGTGNLVLLDIGNDILVMYAHCLMYSIKVHVGDTIKKGDFIAKIGNSGNSAGPHLHFHLSKPDFPKVKRTDIIGMFVASEGISYVFDSYIYYHVASGNLIYEEGMTENIPCIYNQPKEVKNSMPYNKDIIGVIE